MDVCHLCETTQVIQSIVIFKLFILTLMVQELVLRRNIHSYITKHAKKNVCVYLCESICT